MKTLFKTERLTIRNWQEVDADDLYEYCSDTEVTKYLIFPAYTSRAESVTWIQKAIKGEVADFAIELTGTNKAIHDERTRCWRAVCHY